MSNDAATTHRALSGLVSPVDAKITMRKDPAKPYVGLENIPSRGAYLLGWGLASSSISTNCVFRAGDILFGKLRPNLRKCIIAPFDGYCSTDILVLRPNEEVDPSFAGKVLRTERVGAAAEMTSVGTKMPRTSWKHLRELEIFCPGLPEQSKIAQILDTLDTTIHETEAIITKLKSVKQGLLCDLMTRGIDANGELRPPQADAPHLYKESPLGWVPKEWDVPTLGHECSLIRDGTHLPPVRVADGPLLLSVRNMQDGQFILTDQDTRVSEAFYSQMHKNWEVQKGDVLLAIVGATIGKTAIVGDMPKFTLQRSVAVLRGKPDKLLNPFLHLYIGSPKFQLSLWAQVNQTAQPGIYLDQLGGIEIPVPSPVEQEAIQLRLQTLQRRIDDESDAGMKLKKQKSGLMDDLLTGRVRATPLLAEAAQQPRSA